MQQARLSIVAALAGLLAGCSKSPREEWATALERGADFLVSRQGEDGGIRSKTYGILKPGWSLTALSVYAIALCPKTIVGPRSTSLDRALAFLDTGVAAEGELAGGLGIGAGLVDYPCYSASFYILALDRLRPPGWRARARKQAAFLAGIQCREELGWVPTDLAHGGFGFGGSVPRKPAGGDDLNISSTSWALAALRAVATPEDDAVFARARVFVERVQTADGGFFYTPTPPEARSKAGYAPRYGGAATPRPYGSATCDGIRALMACGDAEGATSRARAWLSGRIELERIPGIEGAEHLPMGESMLYYYWAGLAPLVEGASRDRLRELLVARQRGDGSWKNAMNLMREDDPIIATGLALIALSALGPHD